MPATQKYSFLTNQQQHDWAACLECDDAAGALAMFNGNALTGILDELLADALSTRPLPKNSLTAIDDAGLLPEKWMSIVMEQGRAADWAAILDWREERLGAERAKQERKDVFLQNLETSKSLGQRGQGRMLLRLLLLELLDRNPTFAADAKQRDPRCGDELFGLTLDQETPGSSWAADSGLDLADLIADGIRGGKVSAMLGVNSQGETDAMVVRWLDHDPSHRAAWVQLQEKDRVRESHHQDWISRWIPGQWSGSPLEQWCLDEHNNETAPLDHPLFDTPWPTASDDIPAKELRRLYTQEMAPRNGIGGNDENIVIRINEKIIKMRGDLAGVETYRHLACPPDPMAMTLAKGLESAKWEAKTPEGAAHLQGQLEDRRMMNAMEKISVREVCDWVIAQPSWQSWRNRKGDSVIDMALQKLLFRKVLIAQAVVMKLARKCPDILLTRDSTGERALDSFDLSEIGKANVKRTLLKQHQTHHATTKRKPAPGKL